MGFNIGDSVVHKSDRKPRKMVVVARAFKELPPSNFHIARIRDRLAISTGSACSSGIENPSHVLQAIALPEHLIEGALRISIGKFTTDKECDRASTILTEAVHQVRQILA